MSEKRRQYSTEFKEALVRRVLSGERRVLVVASSGVARKMLDYWVSSYQQEGVAGLNRHRGHRAGYKAGLGGATGSEGEAALLAAQSRIAELERLVGQQQVDLNFFHKALQLCDAPTQEVIAHASTPSLTP